MRQKLYLVPCILGVIQASLASVLVMPVQEYEDIPLSSDYYTEVVQPGEYPEYELVPAQEIIKETELRPHHIALGERELLGHAEKRFQKKVKSGLVGLTRPRFGKRGLETSNLVKMTMPRFGKRQVADIVEMVRPRFGRKKRSIDNEEKRKLPKDFIQLGKGKCTLIYPSMGKRTLTMAYINSLILDNMMKELPTLPYSICLEDVKLLAQLQMRSPKKFQAILSKLAKHNSFPTSDAGSVEKKSANLKDMIRPRFGKRGGVSFDDLVRPRFGKRDLFGDVDLDYLSDPLLRSILSPFSPQMGLYELGKRSSDESIFDDAIEESDEKESGAGDKQQ